MTLPYAEIARHNIGSPTMSTNHDIFDTFIAAKQALDELPAVKTALEQARQETEMVYHELSVANDAYKDATIELELLKTRLADKEVALAALTFRETVAARKLDTLRGILGGGDSDRVEPVTGVPNMNAPASGVETPTPSINEPSTIDPFQPSDAVAAKIDGDEREANPTVTCMELAPAETSTINESLTVDNHSADYKDNVLINSASEVAAEVGPTAIGEQPVDSPIAFQSETASHSHAGVQESAEDTNTKPYSAQPYWNKPDLMDWSRWTALGGDPAQWMKEVPAYTD